MVYNNCYNDGYDCYNNSAWYNWARWLFLALIILAAIAFFFIFSCLTARRRRRMGHQPYYGTGWAARPGQYGQQNYNTQQPYYNNSNNPPPPPYGAANDYYARRNDDASRNDVELQSPQPAYQPPKGPPPGRAA